MVEKLIYWTASVLFFSVMFFIKWVTIFTMAVIITALTVK